MTDLSKIKLTGLTQGEQFIVKWEYRLLGNFESALIMAIQRADEWNLQRLERCCPHEVTAYRNYTQTSGWWSKLKAKANIDWDLRRLI